MSADTSSSLDGSCRELTVKLVAWRHDDPGETPAIPEIFARYGERGRCSSFDIRSDTKDAEEAESRSALAFVEEPFGEVSRTWHVMSSEFDFEPAAARELMGAVEDEGGDAEPGACAP